MYIILLYGRIGAKYRRRLQSTILEYAFCSYRERDFIVFMAEKYVVNRDSHVDANVPNTIYCYLCMPRCENILLLGRGALMFSIRNRH